MNSSYLSAPNGVTDFLPSEKAFPCLIDGRFDWDNDLFCIIWAIDEKCYISLSLKEKKIGFGQNSLEWKKL